MAFSASLASRMYLSRTRLSQIRRWGAPRTGRPRGNSRKDSSSSGVQSRKESQAAGKVGSRRRRASLDRQVHPSRCASPSESSPPGPWERSGSASAFIQSRGRVHTPPPSATGIHFSRPNFNPGVTAASLLADPGCGSQTQLSESSSAPTEPRLFSLNPQPSAPSPAQVPTLLGGLLQPDRPAGEGCPNPLALPGSLASLKSLNQATSGPRAPAVNSSSNSAAPAGSTHRAPPSPCLAWPLSDLGLGGCLRRGPASREARRGSPAGRTRGPRSPGAERGRGRARRARGQGPEDGAARRPAGLARGLLARGLRRRPGVGAVISCVRAGGGLGGGCVREGSREVGTGGVTAGAGRLGRGLAGAEQMQARVWGAGLPAVRPPGSGFRNVRLGARRGTGTRLPWESNAILLGAPGDPDVPLSPPEMGLSGFLQGSQEGAGWASQWPPSHGPSSSRNRCCSS